MAIGAVGVPGGGIGVIRAETTLLAVLAPAPPPSTVTLPDGRVLAYDDIGAPDGEVVVYLHGAGDCRLARHPDDRLARDAGVRLLAVDRPGYGRSDVAVDPSFAALAGDAGSLLDELGIAACRLLAWSAGGLRALAAATALGDRCVGITCYAAMPPVEAGLDEVVAAAMPRRQPLVDAVVRDGVPVAEVASEAAHLLLPVVPVPADLAVDLLRDALGGRARAEVESVPGLLEMLAASHVEAAAVHGRAGVEMDMTAEFTAGQLDALLGPTCPVRLIYGERDAVAGPGVGEWYCDRLPTASREVWEGGTHHSLFPRWGELLSG
jgi:pimeloyl-ACP methyl ester carboxylesterase